MADWRRSSSLQRERDDDLRGQLLELAGDGLFGLLRDIGQRHVGRNSLERDTDGIQRAIAPVETNVFSRLSETACE